MNLNFDERCKNKVSREMELCVMHNLKSAIPERTFYLTGEIGSELGSGAILIRENILKMILQDNVNAALDSTYERPPIDLHIYSFGGSVHMMWEIIDLITNSPTPINTYCSGIVASAAFMIFLSGKNRYMTKHATAMYHQPSTITAGQLPSIKDDADQLERHRKMMHEFIIARTSITKEYLEERDKGIPDTFLSAEECLDKKICTEIISSVAR